MVRRVAAIAIGAALATATALAQDAPRSVRVPYPAPTLLTCGGLAFPPSALDGPRTYERGASEPARALRRYLRRADAGLPRSGWFLLAERRDAFEVAAGRGPEHDWMEFERVDGRWRWNGGGGCFMRTRHYGLPAVTWWRRGNDTPASAATRIPVFVQEDACASGGTARNRILRPLVHYGHHTVTVTYFVRPVNGLATCQGVPPTRATLVLDEPLGGRRLRDGGPYPAVPR
jgi:hypothetical protein